jgi:hypothetical protein
MTAWLMPCDSGHHASIFRSPQHVDPRLSSAAAFALQLEGVGFTGVP